MANTISAAGRSLYSISISKQNHKKHLSFMTHKADVLEYSTHNNFLINYCFFFLMVVTFKNGGFNY